jgi:hypothetical protein
MIKKNSQKKSKITILIETAYLKISEMLKKPPDFLSANFVK